jgi:hypothetical protein
MRMIMFDPALSQGSADKKKTMKKSSSVKGLSPGKRNPLSGRKNSLDNRIGSEANLNKDKVSSNDSFEMPKTIYSDVDLSYLDELELNNAFNIFKND